jgi:hypothetical protein
MQQAWEGFGWGRQGWQQCCTSQPEECGVGPTLQGSAGCRVLRTTACHTCAARPTFSTRPPLLSPFVQLRESSDRRLLELVALPAWLPAALASFSYYEAYPLDSSSGTWTMRRDIPTLGRSRGQIFMTTDNILIFRWARGGGGDACNRSAQGPQGP